MPTPLGHFTLATCELGDGTSVAVSPPPQVGHRGLPVTYSVLPQGVLGLKVTYSVEQTDQRGLAVYYLVGPSQSGFSLNGDYTIPAPESMDYVPPSQIGIDLNLGVVIEGYASIVWHWASLSYSEVQALLQYYNPQSPQVTITYPNEEGFWVSRQAMFQPPQLGARGVGESFGSLDLTFTHLIPD